MQTAQALGWREELIMFGTKHDVETKEKSRQRLERVPDTGSEEIFTVSDVVALTGPAPTPAACACDRRRPEFLSRSKSALAAAHEGAAQ
jgi:hypothetical protein